MLCIVPSVGVALSGFDGQELRHASGLFNLMRNLGGAVGIAVVNTWLQDYAREASARMGEALGHMSSGFTTALAGLTQRLSAQTTDANMALLAAKARLVKVVGQQALAIAFGDVFMLMSWMFIAGLFMVPFAKRAANAPNAAAAPTVESH
jgi:DHA2 family multidrug resistance protein